MPTTIIPTKKRCVIKACDGNFLVVVRKYDRSSYYVTSQIFTWTQDLECADIFLDTEAQEIVDQFPVFSVRVVQIRRQEI